MSPRIMALGATAVLAAAIVLPTSSAIAAPKAENPPATVDQQPVGTSTEQAPAAPSTTAAKASVARASTSTRDSAWRGPKLRHPRGGAFPSAVLRWANLVAAVMAEKKIPRRFLPGILAQIQQESSGNEYAVNHWDSNAARGTPSKGLLQVIAPTYRAYAKPGLRNVRYVTNPYANIWAALEYVKQRYGMVKFKYWNRGWNQGY